ncbi:MAG: P-loop NTPase [Synergistaceae bacterium]|nr:P-loop NTPase [Synergistaceae bacterium]
MLNKNYNLNPDQAGELRRLVIDNRENREKISEQNFISKLHTITVLSGKGGVGKSNIAASLGFALADFGRKTVLIDADLGLANLDILCGVRNARYNIAHLIEGSRTLNEILVHFKTSPRAQSLNGSVSLLPGGYGIKEIADLDDYAMEKLFTVLSELEINTDYIIMDAGAGIHKGALSFAYASEITLLITTPEPTSIRDAYGVIKSLGAAAWQENNNPASGLMLVVNMAASSREAQEVAERIKLASIQFLGNSPMYLGYVLKDDAIERSVKNCRIFYRAEPDANASICIRNLAGELLRIFEGIEPEHEHLNQNNSNSQKKQPKKTKQKGISSFFGRLAEYIIRSKN